MKKQFWQELLIALSLSNLLFITGWRRLIYPTSASYHIKLEPVSMDYLALMLNVIIVAVVFLGSVWLARLAFKGKAPISIKLTFLVVFGIILNGIRIQFYESDSRIYLKLSIFIVLLSAGIFAFLKLRGRVFEYAKVIALVLSPFILITFTQAAAGIFSAERKPEEPIAAQLSKLKSDPQKSVRSRVVWIIFDDLDYFVPFELSPAGVELPEFTKLRKESVFATNARSPAYNTIDSLPSLITGRLVRSTELAGKNELLLNFADGTRDKFSEAPNVFSIIREARGNTAVVGWYHSYCRVIGKDLSACEWESFDTLNDFETATLGAAIRRNFEYCLISLPFGFRIFRMIDLERPNNVGNSDYVKRHEKMLDGAKAVVSDPNVDLALIHLPIPHYPYVYDRSTGQFGTTPTHYLDNLVLADRVLGEIREAMEKGGLWDDSNVIVSSDHQWRINAYKTWLSVEDLATTNAIEHPQIPFLLKLKRQHESVNFDPDFNSVVTSALIQALMKNQIASPKEATAWLDRNSSR